MGKTPLKSTSMKGGGRDGRVPAATADPTAPALRLLGDTEERLSEWDIKRVRANYQHDYSDSAALENLTRSFLIGADMVVLPVNPNGVLACGKDHLDACRLAGKQRVSVIVRDITDDEAELCQVEDTLHRPNLTVLDRAEMLHRHEQLLVQLGRRAKPGGQGKRSGKAPAPVTTLEIGKQVGLEERTVQRSLSLARNLSPGTKDLLRHTPVADNQSELTELARLDPKRQKSIARLINKGKARSVKQALSKTHPTANCASELLLPDSRPYAVVARPTQVVGGSDGVLRTAALIALQRQGIAGRDTLGELLSFTPDGDLVIPAPHPSAGPDQLAAVAAVTRLVSEIAAVRSVWAATQAPVACPPPKLSMGQVAALPSGQLEARWASPTLVEVRKAARPLLYLPVQRVGKGGTFIKSAGNTKTVESGFGLVNTISLGCLRWATGWDGCDHACYSDEAGRGGCWANLNQHAIWQANRADEFDVIWNGLKNDIMQVRLPSDGTALLPDARRPQEQRVPFWRCDAESADGSMGLALGSIQMLAEANPDRWFTSICSHYFAISDAMLCWAAALPNLWCCSTVSASFSPEELAVRFAAIERLIGFGISSVIWVCTSRKWDNEPLLERALELVPPEQVVEVPHRSSNHAQELPLFTGRGITSCGSMRYDGDGSLVEFAEEADGASAARVRQPDGSYAKARGKSHARCRNCPTKCGWTALFGGQ